MARLLLVTLVAFGGSDRARSAPPINVKDGCRANPAIVGTCFEVRGYAFASNGVPNLRIYAEGTQRILGVLPSKNEIAPACLRNGVTFEQQVAGRFMVCPFSKENAGSTQLVCVEDVFDAAVRSTGKAARRVSERQIDDCHLAPRDRTQPPAEYALLASRLGLNGPRVGIEHRDGSQEAQSFRALLKHPQAQRWFQSLTTENRAGAQLYGLCGLLLVRPAEYDRIVPRYKNFEQLISVGDADEEVSLPLRDLFTNRNPYGSFPRFCEELAGPRP